MKISSAKREIFLVSLLFIFLCIIFFWRVMFLGKVMIAADVLKEWYPWRAFYPDFMPAHNSILGDSILHYYPLSKFMAGILRSKSLPLWNPYLLCGTPFLAANDPLVLNPLNFFYLFISPQEAFGYANMIKFFLAGLFMYIFLKEINLCKSASFVGSIVFMFNGFFIVWMEHLDIVSAGLWLPLILLFFERMLNNPSKKLFYAILAGVSLAMPLLCGLIQVAFYVWLGAALYVTIRIIQSGENRLQHTVLSAFGFLLGLSLSAAQLLPTLELSGLSQRTPSSYQANLLDIRALGHLITFVLPDFFGSPVDRNYWGLTNYVELCGYIGIFPFILLCLTFFRKLDRRLFSFWIIAAVSLLIYLKTPLEASLYLVPGYGRSIEPYRIIFLYTFAAAALSGLGFDSLVNAQLSQWRIRQFLKFIAGFLAAVSIFLLSFYIFLKANREEIILQSQKMAYPVIKGFNFISSTFLEVISQSYERFLEYYHPFSPTVWVPILLLSASLFLFIFYLKNKGNPCFKLIAISLIIIDLFYFGNKFLAFSERKLIYPSVGSVEFLKKDKGLWRATSTYNVFIPDSLMAYNISTISGETSLFSGRYYEFISCLNKTKKDKYAFKYLWPSDTGSPLLNLLNVKYALTKEALKDKRWELVYDKEVLVYRNKDVLPRAFIVPRIKVIKDKDLIFRELNSPAFNPREYIILEEEAGIGLTDSAKLESEVLITQYLPQRVSINAYLSGNGFLFLSDTYYPGWQVYVDGRKDRIYRANYTFRAVHLNRGRHTIKFIYKPLSFILGLYLSISTFIITLIGIIFLLRKKEGAYLSEDNLN